MSKNQLFTGGWTVRNTGFVAWDSNQVDFNYVSGTKLSPLRAADLPKTVGTGESVSLKLSMVAPHDSGTYKTVWTLQKGKISFCRLTLTIVVK